MENRSNKDKLDLSFLKTKKSNIVSSKDALKDVVPIKWNDSVLNGSEKVLVGSKR